MQAGVAAAGGAGLGAGLMYFLDPDKGKRRRALVRDHWLHAGHQTWQALDKTARDLDHHLHGMIAQARSRLASGHAPDTVLAERVRAKLGRVVSNAHALSVVATGGWVILSGPIPAQEASPLLVAVAHVRGVRGVENRLEVHERMENLLNWEERVRQCALQLEPLRGNWSPTQRLMALAAGSILAGYGLSRRDWPGAAISVLGFGLLGRGLSNVGFRRLVGVDVDRRGVDIEKTITVHAPVEQVYALWSHPEAVSRFLSHVRKAWHVTADHSHWIVTGPAGIPLEWDVVVTRRVPNELLAWQGLPGALVGHAGSVRFERRDSTCTRIDVRVRYHPPAGMLGHGLATLLGADPRHVLDEDLLRFKSLLDVGKTHIHGEVMTLEDLLG